MPNLYIISGCNGSGKTTASYTLLPDILDCRQFVNSDEFAKSLSPFDPSAASFKKSLRNRGFDVVNANNNVLDGIRFMMTQMNQGKMKWTEKSKHTIKEFNSYVWDPKASDRGQDVVIKEHDHCLDADRYFAMKVLYRRKRKNINLYKEGI